MTLRKSQIGIFLFSILISGLVQAAEFDAFYGKGDVISPAAFVADQHGSQVNLRSLLDDEDARVNVLFIFGGGDLGSGLPGHLWCQDSFEDTSILRILYDKYRDKGVNFIAVAESPAFHSQTLGQKVGVFLTDGPDSEDYRKAEQAFIESTLASYESGILPFEPFFDARFRLMFNRSPDFVPPEEYGEVFSWQGAFRSPDETQFYGVPSFWIIDDRGKILAKPFHGNIYHPHDSDVTINYTFRDIDKVLKRLLRNR